MTVEASSRRKVKLEKPELGDTCREQNPCAVGWLEPALRSVEQLQV